MKALILLASLLATGCGTSTSPFIKQTTRDPLWCPPSALAECDAIKEVKEGDSVLEYAHSLTLDYGICRYKHKVLVDCIKKYEEQK